MVVLFFCGIFAGFVAPLLRRRGNAGGLALAAGATTLVIVAIAGLLHTDIREGLATVEANRKEYRFILACEIPVLVLGLLSLRWLKKSSFWTGWAMHVAFSAFVVFMVIWLEFFWHW